MAPRLAPFTWALFWALIGGATVVAHAGTSECVEFSIERPVQFFSKIQEALKLRTFRKDDLHWNSQVYQSELERMSLALSKKEPFEPSDRFESIMAYLDQTSPSFFDPVRSERFSSWIEHAPHEQVLQLWKQTRLFKDGQISPYRVDRLLAAAYKIRFADAFKPAALLKSRESNWVESRVEDRVRFALQKKALLDTLTELGLLTSDGKIEFLRAKTERAVAGILGVLNLSFDVVSVRSGVPIAPLPAIRPLERVRLDPVIAEKILKEGMPSVREDLLQIYGKRARFEKQYASAKFLTDRLILAYSMVWLYQRHQEQMEKIEEKNRNRVNSVLDQGEKKVESIIEVNDDIETQLKALEESNPHKK